MEKTNFGHSTKNIPIPANQEYSKRLIEMTEKLIKRMRWRAHFFLNVKDNLTARNNYGFNSKASPPQVPQLREFEYKMATLIHNIEFRKVHLTEFENSLANHIHGIRGDDINLFIPADKTTNYYKMSASEYQSLLKKSVEKEYKKAPRNTEKSINAKAKQIACKLGIGNSETDLSCCATRNHVVLHINYALTLNNSGF